MNLLIFKMLALILNTDKFVRTAVMVAKNTILCHSQGEAALSPSK